MRYRIGKNMFGSLWLLASALMLGSCVADEGECIADGEQNMPVTLQLNVKVPASSAAETRAGNHDMEPGTSDESYIDFTDGKDYKILVFDADGSFITEDVEISNVHVENGSQYDVYTVSCNISNKGEQKLSEFRVMLLANWKSFDATSSAYPTFASYQAPISTENTDEGGKNIFTEGENLNFTMPGNATTSSWMPSKGSNPKRLIPMFGYSDLLNIRYGDKNGTTMNLVADIPMLRAIAKVEIVDVMDEAGAEKITNVSLSRSNRQGRYIPDIEKNPNWAGNDKNKTQVTVPSLPAIYSSTVPGAKEAEAFVTDLPFVRSTCMIDNIERQVWTAYIPEMHLSSNYPEVTVRPHFNVTVNGKTHAVKFDNYYDGQVNDANKLDAVLRNHIYRYSISGTSASLELDLKVLPWNMQWEEDEWHFDLPTLKEKDSDSYYYLEWTTEVEDPDHPGDMIPNGYIVYEDQLRLFMKPNTNDYAEATFTLAAPLKATWYATLVPLQGKHDAFEFDPDYCSGTITGKVDEPCTIRIRNTRETVADENNEARLVIMVEYPDKTQREAIVVKPVEIGGTQVKNYTIVQQKTAI